MRLEPFPYQIDGIECLRDGFRAGHNRGLLVMLMGAGKSIAALELMRSCAEKNNPSLFLCDRRMLATQIVEVARAQELPSGLLLSGRGHDLDELCQFGSKQTIVSWLKKGVVKLPDFKLIIIDEAHRAISEEWGALTGRWPKARIVGLTATPCLGNGNGMGAYYDFLVQPIKPSGLRTLDRIVPTRAFAPHVPDLNGVKKGKDGDYSLKALAQRMTRENLIGDIPGWWKKLACGRPSIYFGCDVGHALAIRDEFRADGIPAELICDETPDDERTDIRRRLQNGEISVVANCDVLCEGIDWPFVSCIGLVRPTKRLRRYLQMAGRGMRAHDGKTDCVIIDHAGCVLYHGFPDTDRDWPLSADDNVDEAAEKKQKDGQEPAAMQCAKCSALFSGSRTCPECGHVHTPPKKPKEYGGRNGTLIEVTGGDLPPEVSTVLMQRFWGVCIGTAIKRNRNAAMAAAMFRSKFGMPPWEAKVKPLPEGGAWKNAARDVFAGYVRSYA